MASTAASLPSLKTLTLDEIATCLDSGAFSVVDLVQAHLDRIAKFNPNINAIIEVNPNAISIAEALDAELKQSGRRGPLHGVPILVKDNVVTAEDMDAAVGSVALVGAKPARENPAATKLRAAGCVLLGVTNMTEWANFRSKKADDGWSARGGQCVAAYHDDQAPGGSSSGSGVAVDMGLCVLAVGSETTGSIISPSHANSVVGLKPTVGLVSRTAVIPISTTQDTLGPMGRTVADVATMLSAMAGKDPEDSKTALIPFDSVPDYRAACSRHDLSKYRLGVPRNTFKKVPPGMLESFESIMAQLQAQGARVVGFEFPAVARFDAMSSDARCDFMAGGFGPALAAYFATLATNPNGITSLETLYEYTKVTEAEEFPARAIDRWDQCLDVTPDSAAWAAAKESRAYFDGEGGVEAALEAHSLDAILIPTEAWVPNYVAAIGGQPQINIPLGYSGPDTKVKRNDTGKLVEEGPNIPYGFSIVGGRFSEEKMLAIAAAVEKLAKARERADEHRLPHMRD